MSKHTPGPWTAYQGWEDTGIVPDHPEWCQVVGPLQSDFSRISITGHFGMANARLIAAAPRMYEECKAAMLVLSDLPGCVVEGSRIRNQWMALRDVLREAEGKQ